LRVDGTPLDVADRELFELAGRLERAPVLASADGGIGIVGPLPLAQAAARAVLVQLAHRCRPGLVELMVPDGAAWSWATALPHHRGGGDRVIRIIDADDRPGGDSSRAGDPTAAAQDRAGRGEAIIVVAGEPADLPPGLGTIVLVEGHGRAVIDARTGGALPRAIVPELLGASEATTWAGRMRSAGAREGFGGAGALPMRLDLDSVAQPPTSTGSRASLKVAVGARHGGALEIDLVSGGPHAIVAGTTGSGKSEFLLAWLSALAICHPPTRVAFLLVDFKGGAAFEPIRGLPHVTGIVTDLDEAEAERAVSSLRAELRHRESVLRTERARDIVELAPDVDLARLVIVIDEFQAMVERFPDLGAVIADIAARGRSLGVHLVLASQRPNGIVREQVTANCAIRVSLRVMQRADSVAVVGTEAAASIRPDSPGRGIIDVGDGIPLAFQSAQVDGRSLDRLRRVGADLAPARRPWVDPLPARLRPHEADGVAASARLVPGSLVLGLLDEPERQRHDVLAWSPDADGHLLVVGGPGSGRTAALAAVAAAAAHGAPPLAVLRLSGPRSREWDTIQAVLERAARPGPQMLFLIDDLDARFREWPDEHRHAALAALDVIVRDGRRNGVTVVATAGNAHRLGLSIRESFARQLLLRHPTRADIVHAGGSGDLWRDQDPPGSGQWRGHRVQLVEAPPLPVERHEALPPLDLAGSRVVAMVSASPRADASALRAARLDPLLLEPLGDTVVRTALARHAGDADAPGDPDAAARCVVVGDADAWAANWSIAALVREQATIVVHGGQREYRTLAPGPSLPPLLDDAATQCWVLEPAADVRRAGWPPGPAMQTGSYN
jgi:S-DNA-T family DNA segregation ATPase FtsK/SpoIIIE